MALNNEDKQDVKNAYGKAIANKVAKVTRDKGKNARNYFYKSGVEKLGKEKTIEHMKRAFGSRKTRADAQREAREEYEFKMDRQGSTADTRYIPPMMRGRLR